MNTLFEEKSKTYSSKPNYIRAVKYEKGMENGWVIEFFSKEDNDFGFDFKIFNSEDEAIEYYKLKPLQFVPIMRNGEEDIIEYEVEYNEPKPCLWHNRTRRIVDFDHEWEEQRYEILEEGTWIIQWEGLEGFSIYSDEFMKSDWVLNG